MLYYLVLFGGFISIMKVLSINFGLEAELGARIIVIMGYCILLWPKRRRIYFLLRRGCKIVEYVGPRVVFNHLKLRKEFAFCALTLIGLAVYAHAMSNLGMAVFYTFLVDYLVALPLISILLFFWFAGQVRLSTLGAEVVLDAIISTGQESDVLKQTKITVLKIFFIPIMYGGLVESAAFFLSYQLTPSPVSLVLVLFVFGLLLDMVVASGGYLFCSRFLSNGIHSVDSTWGGWFVCLICYPPLLFFFQKAREQVDDIYWYDWLQADQPIFWAWLGLVVLSWLGYWTCTVSFGLKFSNLTWRGLNEKWLYKYFRHPAYVSKNIYWWLHTVPFVGVASFGELLRNFLGLSFVSLIYYLRAKTEERHLLSFKEYRDYHAKLEKKAIVWRLKWLGSQSSD